MRSLSFSLLFSMERAGAHTRKGGRGVGEKRGGRGGQMGQGDASGEPSPWGPKTETRVTPSSTRRIPDERLCDGGYGEETRRGRRVAGRAARGSTGEVPPPRDGSDVRSFPSAGYLEVVKGGMQTGGWVHAMRA